jgi:predicted SAM-dependent methyltransferase
MLLSLIRDILSAQRTGKMQQIHSGTKSVLNVGGGTNSIPIPVHFEGWRHDLLDIDPQRMPDLLCDARGLRKLPSGVYDAVYCSHNLEHYYRHEG